MKSNRNRAFSNNRPTGNEPDNGGKSLFSLTAILPNIIAIAVFAGAYWYIFNHYLFTDYLNYIYWVVNVVITYNIIVASARSLLAPALAILAALGCAVASNMYGMTILSTAEFWQLLIVAGVGFFVGIMLKL